MAFNTQNLKPWVIAAGNELQQRFGLKTIGGWRRTDPFPDHPNGLALDLMIDDIPNGRSIGDAIAAYLVANASRLNVKYIIWYRREWSVKNPKWRPYTDTPNPHIDHVHVTFNSTGSSGNGPSAPTENVGLVDDTKLYLTQIDNVLSWVMDAGNQKRIGFYVLGAVLVFFGIFKFSTVTEPVGRAIGTVTGKVAGKVANSVK